MTLATLDFTPAPGRASTASMIWTQTKLEVLLTLRRGESVLLTLLIPLGLLIFFTEVHVLPASAGRPVDFLVPGIIALAVMSTGFTGLAIATGFERSYLVLKRLGATPLSRFALLTGKTLAVCVVELLQLALIVAVGYALGWHPHGSPVLVVLFTLLGTATFSGLGLLMAGALSAELTLAAANAVYLLLLLLGNVALDLTGSVASVGRALPTGALAHGLRQVLQHGAGIPAQDLLVLLVWTVVGLAGAAATFRWE